MNRPELAGTHGRAREPSAAGDAVRARRSAAVIAALPTGPGLFYRLHHPAVPLDAAHARSVPMHGGLPVQEGFSALPDPHSLYQYLLLMDWIAAPEEVDFHARWVVAFTGACTRTGVDGEPLVVPDGGWTLWLSWARFLARLAVTPRPEHAWSPAPAR